MRVKRFFTYNHFRITNNKYDETKLSNALTAVANGNTTWDKVAFINAVDIDWNGAKPNIPNVSENGITTTGELLKIIEAE